MNINIPKREKPKKEKIYILYDGKRYQLVGVRAMLVPVDENGSTTGKLIWPEVDLDILMLKAALSTRKMDKKEQKRR